MISNIDPVAGCQTRPDDFKNLVDLLAVYSEAENQLKHLEATATAEQLEIVDEHKPEYTKLQQKMNEAEAALEILVRRNPQWIADKKSMKTPYGEVALKKNPPKLIAENPELSVILIEVAGQKDPEFKSDQYLRKVMELDLDALANLSDTELAQFRIRREHNDTFTVKAAKLDLGKAVKSAETKTAAK